MNENATIESVLDKMRRGLNQDGGNLLLKKWEDGVMEVDLVLAEDACLKCILDSTMMTMNLERLMKQELPSVKKVVINDPRDN
jgi:Fe-S cluster biogenesis protein NfuA